MTRNGSRLVFLVINKLTAFVRKFILFPITTKTGKQNIGRIKKKLSIREKSFINESSLKEEKHYFHL